MKNKGFILIYVLIFLALSFLVITGLIYNQKLDNGLRRSEDKGMKDYYMGEAAILYYYQSGNGFKKDFETWKNSVKKLIPKEIYHTTIENYVTNADKASLTVDFSEKTLLRDFGKAIIKDETHKIVCKVQLIHSFFLEDSKLTSEQKQEYYRYFSTLPVNQEGNFETYNIHGEQKVISKNGNNYLVQTVDERKPESGEESIGRETENVFIKSGEESVKTTEKLKKIQSRVRFILNDGCVLTMAGNQSISLQGIFVLRGRIKLNTECVLRGIVFMDKDCVIEGDTLMIDGALIKEGDKIQISKLSARINYMLIFGAWIKNFFDPKLISIHKI